MMKRKEVDSPETQPRRRQPQVSCDFCRKKKLKCDRGRPCNSCAARGLPCRGQPYPTSTVSQPSVEVPSDPSIQARLQSLEQVVFGAGREARISEASSSPSILNSEHQQTARFLDSACTRHDLGSSSQDGRVGFRIATTARLASTPLSTDCPPTDGTSSGRLTWLMTREEALLLLQDFVDNPYHLLPIIHEPSTRAMIDEFYAGWSRNGKANPACAALILSISATSASFFSENVICHHSFASSEEAAQASRTWRQSALYILDESQRTISGCLEEVQARAILAYLVYNTEGCSARFRYLHSCSVAAARDGSLHLIDSPGAEKQDHVPTREVKRRLWWHIASTDWMLGLTGGPLDGTYAVQPRHMNVRYPRNLNDNDLNMCDDTLTFPLNVATQMSVFLQRIRLAEICRSVIDARTPGLPEVEVMDYNRVLALDRLFEQALSEFPPFLQLDAPIPPDAPRHLSLQRSIIQMGFNSRRARLHRPFLLHDTQDQRYRPSRDICLRSARTVLSISLELLESSLATLSTKNKNGGQACQTGRCSREPLAHRLGIFINHLFMACTMLALYAGLNANGAGDCITSADKQDVKSEIHAELVRACRVLAAVGEESTVAAGLVRSLTGVLRRYRVKGVEEVDAGVHDHQNLATNRAGPGPGPGPSRIGAEDEDTEAHEHMNIGDDLNLDGLWGDFPGIFSNTESWDRLFADLESYCAPT